MGGYSYGVGIGNGNAIYTRVPTYPTPYWQYVHESAMQGAGGIEKLYTHSLEAQFQISAQNLINLGKQEQKKEIALMRAAGLDVNDEEDIMTFIARFNEVLMGKQQFEAALKRIKEAMKKENQEKKVRAPSVASIYTSYLVTALTREIEAAISITGISDPTTPFSAISSQLEQIIDRAIMSAWDAMLSIQYEEKTSYFGGEEWKQVREASKNVANFSQYFVQMIRSKIDFSGLLKNLNESNKINLNNKKKKGIHTTIKDALNLGCEIKARSIGGSVQEYIMSIMNSFGAAAQAIVAKGGGMASGTMVGETMTIDSATLFSFNASINAEIMTEKIIDSLNEEMKGATSLKNAASIMDNFYNEYLSKLDETFIVYQSTKSYTLSESFRGFSSGGARKLSAAADFIAESDPAMASRVGSYLNVAYNTGAGTIFSSRRGEVQEQFKGALMASAANMLFDDWVTIGHAQTSGAQAIHALAIEGVNIPLSALLNATGQAMAQSLKDMESFIRVTVTLPGPATKYASSFEEAWANWSQEAARVQSQSTFHVKFLSNFKSIISQWLPL